MSYYVRYGFGKDFEQVKQKFFSSQNNFKLDHTFIKGDACFARYISERIALAEQSIENPILYNLRCYKPFLVELIKWINSNCTGIKVSLERYRCYQYLSGYSYEKLPGHYIGKVTHSDFVFGQPSIPIQKKDIGEIKTIPVHSCTVQIDITKEVTNMAKILLEYLTLVFIRTIDVNEAYFSSMTDNKTIIENIISSATGKLMGHGLYDKVLPEGSTTLIKCLNIQNMEKVCSGETYIGKIGNWHKYQQTPIMDSILERIK